jgi:hypothetical protein
MGSLCGGFLQKGPILAHLAKCDPRWRKASLERMAIAMAMAIKSKVGRTKNVASSLL